MACGISWLFFFGWHLVHEGDFCEFNNIHWQSFKQCCSFIQFGNSENKSEMPEEHFLTPPTVGSLSKFIHLPPSLLPLSLWSFLVYLNPLSLQQGTMWYHGLLGDFFVPSDSGGSFFSWGIFTGNSHSGMPHFLILKSHLYTDQLWRNHMWIMYIHMNAVKVDVI